ncbi:MAG: hypothetical protein J6K74_06490 [Marinifilaceae bacterium]|nr:hypothetical protein [Marinifilaceae bacterium]
MAIEAIKKAYPIIDEQGRACTFPTFGSQVFSEGDTQRALWQSDKGFYADDSAKLDGVAASEYATKEYVNSLGAEDVGALPENGTAANSEKLGGKAASEYALASSVSTLAPFFISQNTVLVNTGFDSQPTSSSSKIFTAPADGIFYLFADRGSSWGNTIFLHVLNPDESVNSSFPFPAYDAYAVVTTIIPIAKGMKLKMNADAPNGTWTVREQKFLYNA